MNHYTCKLQITTATPRTATHLQKFIFA